MRLITMAKWTRALHGRSDIHLRLRTALRTTLFLCTPFLLAYTTFQLFGIRINITSSLPRGLYMVSESHSASLVEFCPEGEAAAISLARAYRAPGGNCPDGGMPLLKPVAAVSGDCVEVTSNGIHVNGKLIPNSTVRLKDHRDRPLKPWPDGEYVVPTGTLWVISDFNGWSFDSRYLGPIPCSLVRHGLRPLGTFPTKVPES